MVVEKIDHMSVPPRPGVAAKVGHVGELRITMPVLIERKDSHAFLRSVLPQPPSQKKRARRREDSHVPRPRPAPLRIRPREGRNRMAEQGVPLYGKHELVRDAEGRRPRKHYLGVEKSVNRAEADQIKIRVDPSEFSKNHITGGIHALDRIRIFLI